MSELRFESLTMPAAPLGPVNPLPPLTPPFRRPQGLVSPSIPDIDRRYFGYGMEFRALPYALQDDYGRQRSPRAFRTAVLENQYLKATFLLELGGRLWSLIHKAGPSGGGGELLDVNPVLQPTNLAIRNAWFSGGVEWNPGTPGHSALGFAPLFTAIVRRAARGPGSPACPILRLYEFDRGRAVPFQIDFWLPDDCPVLLARPRIINPHDQTIPLWWWSNIAVPERDGGRVLAPAAAGDAHDYEAGERHMLRRKLPLARGMDVTYPRNHPFSGDMYFRIPCGQRPWSCALDRDGRGLVHASTSRLQGRKLFFWGMSHGGRRWQEFLAEPGHAYIELQGGLAPTQAECIPMPPGSDWSWLEAYGLMEADPRIAHGQDWTAAWKHVDQRLEGMIPTAQLNKWYEESAAVADAPPQEVVIRGSGWGALENHRRTKAGEPPTCGPSMPFTDDTLGPDQAPWLTLLDKGFFPAHPPQEAPRSWMVQAPWEALLQASLATKPGDNWAAWLHAGVMHHDHGRLKEAKAAWEKSLALARSGWALRNLGVLAGQDEKWDAAADLYLQAVEPLTHVGRLAIECLAALVNAGRNEAALRFIDRLPPPIRAQPRIDFHRARAHMQAGDLDAAAAYLASNPEIPDVREGELMLSDFWFEVKARQAAAAAGRPVDEQIMEQVHRDCPVPRAIDFRQRVHPPTKPPAKAPPKVKAVR